MKFIYLVFAFSLAGSAFAADTFYSAFSYSHPNMRNDEDMQSRINGSKCLSQARADFEVLARDKEIRAIAEQMRKKGNWEHIEFLYNGHTDRQGNTKLTVDFVAKGGTRYPDDIAVELASGGMDDLYQTGSCKIDKKKILEAARIGIKNKPREICEDLKGDKLQKCVNSSTLPMLANGELAKCLAKGAGNGFKGKPGSVCVGEKVYYQDPRSSEKCVPITISKLISGNYRQESLGGYMLYRFKDSKGELDWTDDSDRFFNDEAVCQKFQASIKRYKSAKVYPGHPNKDDEDAAAADLKSAE
ncbi:MAG: hypothetical protein ACXWQJ_18960 [Bdellovibrionota bacterium]